MKKRSQTGSDPATRSSTTLGLASLAFEQFSAGLYRYLLRRLRNTQNAEDLSQEVYLRLLRTTEPGQVRSPQAYVYRVALNVLCEFQMRQRSSEVSFDSEAMAHVTEELADEAATPETVYEQQVQEARLERVIHELPPMQRAVLRLATQHPLSHAQIAEQLGISVNTMRSHLYKAIDHCRHRMAQETE